MRAQAEAQGVKLGQLAQPLRAALTGGDASPGIFEVMAVLGREEALGRIADAVGRPLMPQCNMTIDRAGARPLESSLRLS